jgi:hypothetical protein
MLLLRRLACAGVAAGFAGAVLAQQSPYYIGISQGLTYEDNLIRLRDNQQTPPGLFQADTVSSTALVAGVDQTWGRQRLQGSGSVRANRYKNNRDFDNQGYSLNLGLQWETIERLSGSVRIAADRQLRADLRDRAGNFILGDNSEASQDIDLRVRLGIAGPWALQAGGSWRKDRFSAEASKFRDYDQRAGSASLRYRPSAASEFGIGLSRSQVDYPRLLTGLPSSNDRRITDNVDLSALWAPSGLSTLTARFSRSKTSYQPFPDRNFTANTGTVDWNWQATGRTRIVARLARDIGQDSDRATTAYSRITDTLSLGLEYGVSAKVLLNANVGAYRRDIVGNGFFVAGVSGSDDGNTATLGIKWAALRSLTLGCNAIHDKRGASDNPLLNDAYSANAVSCFGQFVLQ